MSGDPGSGGQRLCPRDQFARRLQTGDRALINELHQRSLHLAGLVPDFDRHRLREQGMGMAMVPLVDGSLVSLLGSRVVAAGPAALARGDK